MVLAGTEESAPVLASLAFVLVICMYNQSVSTVQFSDPISPSPQAALAQTKGNPGDKLSEFKTNKGFRNSGCYKDTESRAVPSLEGKRV